MIVISHNFVLSANPRVDPDRPAVGYRNIVTPSTIVADTAEANYPASNLANPATDSEWRAADDSEQYLTITVSDPEDIDYVGIARHNFGSAEIPVSIWEFVDGIWQELVEDVMPADDSPLLFRLVPQSRAQIRIRMKHGTAAPRAAVVYVGKLLDLQRRIYVGHTPLPDGRKLNVANGRSESGVFLGRIVLGEWRESTVSLSLLSPAWFRANMRPFLKAAAENPFFFAWRPESYPDEVGFGVLTNDPMPVPEAPSNKISLELIIRGVA